MSQGDLLHVVSSDTITDRRKAVGRTLIWGAAVVLAVTAVLQVMQTFAGRDFGFQT
jgi:multiple sugar transport system permease protein